MLGNKLLEEQVALRITSIHLVTRFQQQHTGNYTNDLSGKKKMAYTGELLKSDIWAQDIFFLSTFQFISISKKGFGLCDNNITRP